jgi:hypothetical protein
MNQKGLTMRNPIKLCLFLSCLAALSGCESLRESAGLTKKSPDEFAVTTKAPLVIPPDFNLHPPAPGAAPTNSTDATTTAQAALFSGGDTATVAANLQGDYSPGERMLLASAGVQNNDPAIRQQLQSDRPSMQGADADFTARLLATPSSANNGMPINASTNPPKSVAVPVAAPKKSSGGWFDWF